MADNDAVMASEKELAWTSAKKMMQQLAENPLPDDAVADLIAGALPVVRGAEDKELVARAVAEVVNLLELSSSEEEKLKNLFGLVKEEDGVRAGAGVGDILAWWPVAIIFLILLSYGVNFFYAESKYGLSVVHQPRAWDFSPANRRLMSIENRVMEQLMEVSIYALPRLAVELLSGRLARFPRNLAVARLLSNGYMIVNGAIAAIVVMDGNFASHSQRSIWHAFTATLDHPVVILPVVGIGGLLWYRPNTVAMMFRWWQDAADRQHQKLSDADFDALTAKQYELQLELAEDPAQKKLAKIGEHDAEYNEISHMRRITEADKDQYNRKLAAFKKTYTVGRRYQRPPRPSKDEKEKRAEIVSKLEAVVQAIDRHMNKQRGASPARRGKSPASRG